MSRNLLSNFVSTLLDRCIVQVLHVHKNYKCIYKLQQKMLLHRAQTLPCKKDKNKTGVSRSKIESINASLKKKVITETWNEKLCMYMYLCVIPVYQCKIDIEVLSSLLWKRMSHQLCRISSRALSILAISSSRENGVSTLL